MLLRYSRHPGINTHNLWEEGINSGSRTYYFHHTRTWSASPEWLMSSMPGPPLTQHKNEKRYTPSTLPFILTWLIWKNDYDGEILCWDLKDLKLPDNCLAGEEKPRKNLSQETCAGRASNPGPLRDRRAGYRLLHNSTTYSIKIIK